MKHLKTLLIIGVLALGLHQTAASITTTVNTVVPDDNRSGISSTINVSSDITSITNVNIRLNISGGFNGDLYAYLTHDGATAILLNRIGTGGGNTWGFADAGMNAWFQDSGSLGNIHTNGTGGLLNTSSTFTPDGRYADPSDVTAVNAATPSHFLSSFNGSQAFGAWTLFVADVSGGAESTLNSWELEIQGVPEPVNVALGIFGGLFCVIHLQRWYKARRLRTS